MIFGSELYCGVEVKVLEIGNRYSTVHVTEAFPQ